jgi:hypothetical protein
VLDQCTHQRQTPVAGRVRRRHRRTDGWLEAGPVVGDRDSRAIRVDDDADRERTTPGVEDDVVARLGGGEYE